MFMCDINPAVDLQIFLQNLQGCSSFKLSIITCAIAPLMWCAISCFADSRSSYIIFFCIVNFNPKMLSNRVIRMLVVIFDSRFMALVYYLQSVMFLLCISYCNIGIWGNKHSFLSGNGGILLTCVYLLYLSLWSYEEFCHMRCILFYCCFCTVNIYM